jgi:multidrug efflux pump subunit AcrB
VYANVDHRDLGSVAREVEQIVQELTPRLPRGTFIDVRGQVETMNTSFRRLGLGMIFAVVLVYLLMVVNFQSWLDPFIILMAIPGALSAGYTRVRPVIMTASAMIIGMLPMALGLGEGGEQNAPLGRAVIGGLIVATFATLFFVPIVYSYLRKTPPADLDRQIDREEREENLQ